MRWRNQAWWLAWLLLWPLCGMASDDPVAAAAERIAAEAGSHRVVVIGEMHGTREAPAVVAALATHYAAREPVLVGLEVSRSEHAALSEYMRSDGSDAARGQMRAGEFWDVPPERNDGRRTEDILDLVESLRRLRVEGHDVAVVPFDISPGMFVDPAARDRDMASYLRAAFNALPRGRMLVLTGNVHAMVKLPVTIDDGRYRSATQLLADLEPFSASLTASSGTIWGCVAESCGIRQMRSPLQTGTPDERFDFHYVLPESTVARLIGQD